MTLLAAALAGLTLTGGPLSDPDAAAGARADLTCAGVYLAVISTASDTQTQFQGTAGFLYFLGRLEGRDAQTDWVARLGDFLPTLTAEAIQTAAPRCGQMLIDRGAAMQAVGKRMTEEGR